MNTKKILLITLVLLNVTFVFSQKYFTRTGEISFHASTPLENIDAVSNSASSVFDFESGKIQWAVLVKSFEFKKALMQEHFNENYMESSKIPKAKFSGTIANIDILDLTKDGNYTIDIEGILEIHGVEKNISSKADFTVNNGVISASTLVEVAAADFDIEIPSVVRDKIAKVITININTSYELLEKN